MATKPKPKPKPEPEPDPDEAADLRSGPLTFVPDEYVTRKEFAALEERMTMLEAEMREPPIKLGARR